METTECMETNNSNCIRTPSDEVLVLIVFDRSLCRAFTNSIIKEKNIIRNYGNGTFLGFVEEVEVLEGDWPAKLTFGLLHFDCASEAHRWSFSDPILRQQDWLEQVDMFVVPMTSAWPRCDSCVVQLMNLKINFEECFSNDCKPQLAEHIKNLGGIPGVVCTDQVKRWRGRRDLDHLIINVWPSLDAVKTLYACEEYQQAKELRQQLTTGDVIVGELKKQVA